MSREKFFIKIVTKHHNVFYLLYQVDISLVNHYPHTHHKNQLMSATAKLVIEVSALHTGKNGNLEISCHSTIPDYAVQYADIKKESVTGNYSIRFYKIIFILISFFPFLRENELKLQTHFADLVIFHKFYFYIIFQPPLIDFTDLILVKLFQERLIFKLNSCTHSRYLQ